MTEVNIKISVQRLQQLIAGGHLCIEQVQALDPNSKAALWRLCLECCGTGQHLTKYQPIAITTCTDPH